VLLENIDAPAETEQMIAAAETDAEIDGVVESLVGGKRDFSALGRKLPGFDTDDLT
jgi:2-C-methyl-D-erythritol 2,4-cyclodiphosphate synthase